MTFPNVKLSDFANDVLIEKCKILQYTFRMPTNIAVCSERLFHIRAEGSPFYNGETYLGMNIQIDNSLNENEFKLI